MKVFFAAIMAGLLAIIAAIIIVGYIALYAMKFYEQCITHAGRC